MGKSSNQKGYDIESGYNNNNNINNNNRNYGQYGNNNVQNLLYPTMLESPQLRWAFIRKVYAIISMQLILTVAVATVVVFYRPIPRFIVETTAGLVVRIAAIVLTLIVMILLYFLHKRHPLNFVLLALFTIGISFSVGLSCAYSKGIVVLEAVIICAVVVVSLTLYTFWAVKRGSDFSFLGPFLFASLLVLFVFALIQMVVPMGKTSLMIYSALASLLFCGYIIYDTDNMIKRHSYDDYIWAAVSLYLDIINLFHALLILLGLVSE